MEIKRGYQNSNNNFILLFAQKAGNIRRHKRVFENGENGNVTRLSHVLKTLNLDLWLPLVGISIRCKWSVILRSFELAYRHYVKKTHTILKVDENDGLKFPLGP